jgi:phosphoribosylformimino-5-aminoimidazole carboxamide ribotide isomerase
MEVFPAVDVLEGRAVRLSQGQRDHVTLEGGDPVELARRFAGEGAARLHLVDLDGAFSGMPSLDLVAAVAAGGGIPLQVGGGYRTVAALESALDAGADRVIVGTAALSEEFIVAAVERIGQALVVAVALRCAAAGVARLLVTSASRDGSLAGPDLGLLEQVLPAGLPVIAAGGISSTDDLRALRDLGCEAAVAGSALLGGRFTLAEAHAALSSGPGAPVEESGSR